MSLTPELLEGLLNALPDGVSLIEAGPGHRVVYLNDAAARLAGNDRAQLTGAPSRLFAESVEAAARAQLTEALSQQREVRVLFRDRRGDGTSFWHDVQLRPVAQGPLAGHALVVHREAGARTSGRADAAAAEIIQRVDVLTGLATRLWCEQMLVRDCSAAGREGRPLTLFLVHIDALERYAETFGRSGADACERRVGRALAAAFRRASDCLAHWEPGRFLAFASAMSLEQASTHAATLLARVRELRIHHPRSTAGRYLTASIGVGWGVPGRHGGEQALIAAAQMALGTAQGAGGDCVHAATLPQEQPSQES
jgi:diguanylate cyclase (GGDEF)-like protein/PAS domain S-box-containing protein